MKTLVPIALLLLFHYSNSFGQVTSYGNINARVLNPHVLAKSVQANRNLMKDFFLCDCLIRATPKDTSNNKDSSLTLYYELLGNYSFLTRDTLLGYTRMYANSILKDHDKSRFTFISCMKGYSSAELNKFIISLDSGLYISKRKTNQLNRY